MPNRRRRPPCCRFFIGIAWSLFGLASLFTFVYLMMVAVTANDYPAPVDAAQQVEVIE